MKNITVLTTNQLREYPADGSLFVGHSGQDFSFWGVTDQYGGDLVVHLEYADAGAERHDIEVAKADLDREAWDL